MIKRFFGRQAGSARPTRHPVRRPAGLRVEGLEARDCPALLFDTSNVDTLFGAYRSPLLASLADAASKVGAYLTPDGPGVSLTVRLTRDDGIPTANGGPGTASFVESVGSTNTFESGALKKARTGTDDNGADPDIVIRMDLNTYDDYLAAGQSQVSQTVSNVLAHELLHGLGWFGYRDLTTAQLHTNTGSGYTDYSRFDRLTTYDGTHLYFTGAKAEAVYGGPVPLSDHNWYHVGNDAGVGAVPALQNDLMFGGQYAASNPLVLSRLDAAVLADLGWGVEPLLAGDGWGEVTTQDATAAAAAGTGKAVASFPGYPLLVNRGSGYAGVPTPTNPSGGYVTATAVDINAAGDVAAYFPGAGVYKFTYSGTAYTAAQIYPGNGAPATAVGIDGAGRVVVNFTGYGLYRYSAAAGGWQRFGDPSATDLTVGSGTADAAALDVNEAGDVAAAFTGYGAYVFTSLTQYRIAYAYTSANGSNVTLIGIAADRSVVGNFTGYGVQRYNWANNSWATLSTPQAVALDVNEAGDVVFVAAPVSGGGVYRRPAGATTWTSLDPLLYGTGVVPGGVAVDETGAVLGDFGGDGFWRHT